MMTNSKIAKLFIETRPEENEQNFTQEAFMQWIKMREVFSKQFSDIADRLAFLQETAKSK